MDIAVVLEKEEPDDDSSKLIGFEMCDSKNRRRRLLG